MGNCVNRGMKKRQFENDRKPEEGLQEGAVKESGSDGVIGREGGKVRIKVVLTKEELEWLMVRLNDKEVKGTKKNLVDVLEELGKEGVNIVKVEGPWRPSLDSIMETPEVPDQMDR